MFAAFDLVVRHVEDDVSAPGLDVTRFLRDSSPDTPAGMTLGALGGSGGGRYVWHCPGHYRSLSSGSRRGSCSTSPSPGGGRDLNMAMVAVAASLVQKSKPMKKDGQKQREIRPRKLGFPRVKFASAAGENGFVDGVDGAVAWPFLIGVDEMRRRRRLSLQRRAQGENDKGVDMGEVSSSPGSRVSTRTSDRRMCTMSLEHDVEALKGFISTREHMLGKLMQDVLDHHQESDCSSDYSSSATDADKFREEVPRKGVVEATMFDMAKQAATWYEDLCEMTAKANEAKKLESNRGRSHRKARHFGEAASAKRRTLREKYNASVDTARRLASGDGDGGASDSAATGARWLHLVDVRLSCQTPAPRDTSSTNCRDGPRLEMEFEVAIALERLLRGSGATVSRIVCHFDEDVVGQRPTHVLVEFPTPAMARTALRTLLAVAEADGRRHKQPLVAQERDKRDDRLQQDDAVAPSSGLISWCHCGFAWDPTQYCKMRSWKDLRGTPIMGDDATTVQLTARPRLRPTSGFCRHRPCSPLVPAAVTPKASSLQVPLLVSSGAAVTASLSSRRAPTAALAAELAKEGPIAVGKAQSPALLAVRPRHRQGLSFTAAPKHFVSSNVGPRKYA
eukprot:TRINITY_DN56866_c0_g1_i1.p1 TRINITY_DN56866_c0_g1~~TRINITY_DN56866_c0_g1_i1.p1  ORF type:complete len:620 (+),score=104.42 TRINITY_DN56866_c0_g1_i1:36-1895(+)